MNVGSRIVTLFEILIITLLFAMFAGLMVTSGSTNRAIENTKDFVETVRYNGCISQDMYYQFLESFDEPVDVRIRVDRQWAGRDTDAPMDVEFDSEIVSAINSAATDYCYQMERGDRVEVTVRRIGESYFNRIVGQAGVTNSDYGEIVAKKGGMILHTYGE